jgi:iron complex transport system substrate-binding protein
VERPTRDTGGASGDVGTSGDAGLSSKDEVLVRRSEELPTRPGRIISMAPNLTETLFALGAGDRVVGVTKFCDWPEAVDEIPEVGGFVDPNFEKILSLRPDLVVGTVGGGDPRMAERLDEAGLPYAYWRMSSIPETLATIEGLADVVGASERGVQLVAEMREGLSPRDPPPGGRPEVLFVLGRDPLVVAGPGSLLDELIARAGGTNAIESGAGTYPRLDIERVLALDPDIIMDASMTGRRRDAASFWERYDSLTAVRDRGVVTFEDPVLLRPGPRLPRALELIREAM